MFAVWIAAVVRMTQPYKIPGFLDRRPRYNQQNPVPGLAEMRRLLLYGSKGIKRSLDSWLNFGAVKVIPLYPYVNGRERSELLSKEYAEETIFFPSLLLFLLTLSLSLISTPAHR